MAFPKIKISNNSGDVVGVTNNKLDVNAVLSASDNIEIGNVDIKLNGTGVSANNGAADAGTVRVTVASDSTGVLSVDDNAGSLTVDGTVTANAGSGTQAVSLASVPSHAVTNAGTFAVQSTLQAGSAAVGKLAANSGVDIGDVDVTSNVHPSGLGTINSLARVNVPQTGAEALSVTCSITETAAKEIIIQASSSNTDSFCVGDNGTVHETNGIVMQPGDTLILPIADISTIYWDAPASVQKALVTIIK